MRRTASARNEPCRPAFYLPVCQALESRSKPLRSTVFFCLQPTHWADRPARSHCTLRQQSGGYGISRISFVKGTTFLQSFAPRQNHMISRYCACAVGALAVGSIPVSQLACNPCGFNLGAWHTSHCEQSGSAPVWQCGRPPQRQSPPPPERHHHHRAAGGDTTHGVESAQG